MLDIVIATRDNVNWLLRLIKRIQDFTSVPYQIYLQDTSLSHHVHDEFANQTSYQKLNFEGLSRTWNEGIKRGNYPYVCILNDDCLVGRHWTTILEVLNQQDDIYLITPVEHLYLNMNRFECFSGINNVTPENFDDHENIVYERNKGIFKPLQITQYREVTKGNDPPDTLPVTGACFFFRRKVLDEIGYLDEQFRLFYEDIDFFLRINYKYRIAVSAYNIIYHHRNFTISQVTNARSEMEESCVKFCTKWGPIP
mgnify:CR=1 FL=1